MKVFLENYFSILIDIMLRKFPFMKNSGEQFSRAFFLNIFVSLISSEIILKIFLFVNFRNFYFQIDKRNLLRVYYVIKFSKLWILEKVCVFFAVSFIAVSLLFQNMSFLFFPRLSTLTIIIYYRELHIHLKLI